MQFLPALTRDTRAIAREKRAGAHLPYAAQIDPQTIMTRDGLLMQFVQLRGLIHETADTGELNYRKALRDATLQAIGSSRFALYHHTIRRPVDVALEADFPDAFSAHLDARWRAKLASRELYTNDLFLTLVRRPLPGRLGLLEAAGAWLGKRNAAAREALRAEELRQLNAARETLVAALGSYGPKTLQLYDSAAGTCSEPLEFLGALFNGAFRPMLLPYEDIGDYLPARRVSFGQNAIELGQDETGKRRFSAMVSIKDYAGHSAPGMFDELLRLSLPMTVTQSFAFVDRKAALDRMNLALRRLKTRR
jgi:type IV secretion system protein VirB4